MTDGEGGHDIRFTRLIVSSDNQPRPLPHPIRFREPRSRGNSALASGVILCTNGSHPCVDSDRISADRIPSQLPARISAKKRVMMEA